MTKTTFDMALRTIVTMNTPRKLPLDLFAEPEKIAADGDMVPLSHD